MKHLATWIEQDRGKHFGELVEKYPDFKLWDARVVDVPWDQIDGLLLTGGCDIHADYLRQRVPDPSVIIEPDLPRDKWEFAMIPSFLASGKPVFAICRGLQVLNVILGGTLLLDIPGHKEPEQKYGNLQELRFDPSTRVRIPKVNSSHHQAIDKLGDGLEVEAWCASDGVIEQVRLRDHPFCLAVQYHPERDLLHYQPLFDAFFAQVR